MTLATGTGIRESTSGHPAGSSEFDSTFPEAPGPDQHPGLTPSSAPNDSPTHGNDPLCLGQEYPEGHCQDVVAAHNSLGRDELVPAHAISGALARLRILVLPGFPIPSQTWQGPFQFGESRSQTAAGTPPAFPANYNIPTGLVSPLQSARSTFGISRAIFRASSSKCANSCSAAIPSVHPFD